LSQSFPPSTTPTGANGHGGAAGAGGHEGNGRSPGAGGHEGMPPTVRMAHDIALQFQHLPTDAAAAAVAAHIKSFWDPRMRAQLREQSSKGYEMEPTVAAAIALLNP
jgi:formate dehydrogenase subunit delta